jgi:predicted TIM-barrel fold metal-dependent hydrolase
MSAMHARQICRRTFLKASGLMAVGAAGVMSSQDTRAQVAVPNSAGTAPPRLKAPPNACDCHHHIYDAVRFPQPARATAPLQPNARLDEYKLLQRRLQTMRSVVVTPSAYDTDNRVTLDAITQFGSRARGVAVVRPNVTDAELKALAKGGVRGIRFSLTTPSTAATTIDMIEPLSKRAAALGWHVQINMTANQIADAEALWNRLPSPIVFDHIGHISGPEGTRHPAYTVIRRLIDKGRTWVKLSVTYDNTTDGPPGYADIVMLGQSMVKAAPERLVWGSNWPHPNESRKPDDALLFDLMTRWAPDGAIRRRILVENPAVLYGFDDA